MNEQETARRDPDLEIADALNELVRKLRSRQEIADRQVARTRKHKRTLDKVIPRLARIADDIAGGGAATSNGHVSDPVDAVATLLQERGGLPRVDIRRATGLHPKTLDKALRVMLEAEDIAYDGDRDEYAWTR